MDRFVSVNKIDVRKNFKELKIWQKGFEIAAKSFKLIESFPKEVRFGLSIQVTIAAVSIHPISQKEAAGPVKRTITGSWKSHWAPLSNLKHKC